MWIRSKWRLAVLSGVVVVVVGTVFMAGVPSGKLDASPSSIPESEILSGGPPKDGIPALSSPRFVSASNVTYLSADDRVVGIALGVESRAYPLRILNWHEIVNDRLAGRAIAITYCPLTGSAVAFDRVVGDEELEFGVSGKLYRSNVLMYDRESDSLWSQLGEMAVKGPRSGTALNPVPIEVTTWADWKERHPATLVLSQKTGYRRDYGRDPYARYRVSPELMFPVGGIDLRLPRKKLVIGIRQGGMAKAYVLDLIPTDGLLDRVGGRTIRVDYDSRLSRAAIRDAKTGEHLPTVVAYWFAWAAFNPHSALWEGAQ